jgi:hypothetical protein
MEIPPDNLESVGVNDLFVEVTVDVSFATDQTVVGHIDEIHILSVVRTTPIVGFLSPSQICDMTPPSCCAGERWIWRYLQILLKIS